MPGSGVSKHQRLSKSSAKPEAGPECSVPASGCPGMNSTLSGRWGVTASITARFTEPTSVTVAPGFSHGAISAATSRHRADRHAEDHQIGALDRLRRRVEDLCEPEPRRLGPGLAVRAWPVMRTVCARAADRVADRRGDQPEPDQRDVARRPHARTRTNPATASATRAQASVSPTVILSACGSL